jgi:hypothetical protein
MELQRVFLEAAPSPLSECASVGYLTRGVLVLLARDGAAAAKLTQMAPSLLAAYQKRGFEVTKVRVNVQPEE